MLVKVEGGGRDKESVLGLKSRFQAWWKMLHHFKRNQGTGIVYRCKLKRVNQGVLDTWADD